MKRVWLVSALAVVFTLVGSVWSYRTSLNRQEPMVAVLAPSNLTINPFTVSGFTREGPLRVYLLKWDSMKFIFNYKGTNYNYSTTAGNHFDTAFSVKPNETVKLTVTFSEGTLAYGWSIPTDPATRNCKSMTDPVVAAAQAQGETVISVECWNDDNEGDDPYDDFEVVITQPAPAASPSPSPSPSPTPTPTPTPSPSEAASTGSGPNPDQAQFVIRKFSDANKNGVKDGSEGSVKKEWLFKVSQNADPSYDYTVDSDTGEGRTITVGRGTKLTVEEVVQPGWQITTDKIQMKNLTESRLYKFDFGNHNPAVATGDVIGPTQPDTGGSTGLTLALLTLIVTIPALKLFLKAHA